MATKLIDKMVQMVQEGTGARAVWESTLAWKPGTAAKVNKATKVMELQTGTAISVPEGTIVTVVGVGGGSSGVDPMVQLPDGKKGTIPFGDIGV